MSRTEADDRDTAFASNSATGHSHALEYPSQRRESPEYPANGPRGSYPSQNRPVYSQSYSGHDQYGRGDAERSRYSRGQHSPSQERQYQHELELMKAREEQERVYGAPLSRPSQPTEPEHTYGGVPAPREVVDEYGSRSASAERPNLEGFSKVEDGKRYQLIVVQHPSRARMCGFGDKDRRPLSPTLIVKLVITDEATGEEISPVEINTSLFLLATDLCHPDDLMLAPRNILVHHHASSLPVHSMQQGTYPSDEFAHRNGPSFGNLAEGTSEGDYRAGHGSHGPNTPDASRSGVNTFDARSSASTSMQPGTFGQGQAESYTRNLVGAAVASASVLKDEQDQWCIFFVFQDISVRTEGVYRIKLMFVNLEVRGRVGTGVAEALAETYTDPFTVYSPRRFPGMLDPTPLSRKLASQGIKIPVRNDKKKQRRRNEDDEGGGDGDFDGGSGGDDEDD